MPRREDIRGVLWWHGSPGTWEEAALFNSGPRSWHSVFVEGMNEGGLLGSEEGGGEAALGSERPSEVILALGVGLGAEVSLRIEVGQEKGPIFLGFHLD